MEINGSNEAILVASVATLHEYFFIDFPNALWIPIHGSIQLSDHNNVTFTHDVEVRVHLAYEANAAYVTAYIPASANAMPVALTVLESAPDVVSRATGGIVVNGGQPGDPSFLATEFSYARRVFLYIDSDLSEAEAGELVVFGKRCGLTAIIRSKQYEFDRSKSERPIAFISHDSRDKASVAQPLAMRLTILGCPVWFDKFSLQIGDNLRESIERGIRECQKCVLIVSPNFLANDGWSKSEFEMIFNREVVERQHVILPVWVDVTPARVYEYSSTLVGRYALNWCDGLDDVAQGIRRVLESGASTG